MDFSHIKTQEVLLGDYDINTENLLTINLFNNIEQIGYSLIITINDVTDIKNKMPIKGGETLKLTMIDRYGTNFKKEFILIDVNELDRVNEYKSVVKMSFVSKEAYTLSTQRDYSYYNDSVSNIIKNYNTFIDTKPTSIVYPINIPGFTYTKAIQYMITNFTKSHVCFENNEGYVFSDINDLLDVEVPKDTSYDIVTKNPYYRYKIVSWDEIQVFNSLNDAYNNIYSNAYVTYNPNSKSIEKVIKTIDQEQQEITLLGDGDNWSDSLKDGINTKYNIKPYNENVLTNCTKTFGLFNKKLEMLINGDLNVQVGQVIDVLVYDRFNNDFNKQTNGKYIVTKVGHSINQTDYYTKLEVSKNTYFKKVEK